MGVVAALRGSKGLARGYWVAGGDGVAGGDHRGWGRPVFAGGEDGGVEGRVVSSRAAVGCRGVALLQEA